MNLLTLIKLILELFPAAHAAVQLVQQAAPAATPGAAKFDAALNAVTDVVAKAPDAVGAFVTAKAALKSGDSAALGATIGHMIELSVSISKTFGLFKAAPAASIDQPAPSADLGPGRTTSE